MVKIKKKYADPEQYRRTEYFRNESRANDVRDEKNMFHGLRIQQKLRVLKWGRPSSPGYPEAMKIQREAIEGIWETVSLHIDSGY